MADSTNVNQSKKWVADVYFVEGLYQALFSFRLAHWNVIFKAKRKQSLISGYNLLDAKKNKKTPEGVYAGCVGVRKVE